MGTIILQQITHQCQVAQRLAHLLAFLIDHPGMHPETSEGRFTREVFRLRNLACMMWKDQVSKSLGNLTLVSNLLKDYSPHAIRIMLQNHHYRYPWECFPADLQHATE